jgi:hypothetical protein
MRLLIVIVNYRVTQLAIDCLRSLAPEVAATPGVRVALVENGSGDDSAERLAAAIRDNGWTPWVTLTAIHPNLGFTGGNNVAIRPALQAPDPPDHFLLLNSDTLVRPNALWPLIEFMDANPRVGIAGSRLEYPDETVQRSAFRFITPLTQLEQGLGLGVFSKAFPKLVVAPPAPTGRTRCDWVSGASMIVRRQVFEQLGGLDENLYTYFDDPDICLNALRRGWETWYVPESRVVHLIGQSTGLTDTKRPNRRPKYWFQARRYYFLKNFGVWGAGLADAGWIGGFALWRLRRMIQGKPDTDPPYMLLDSVRHSVFLSGFRKRPAENPALLADGPPSAGVAAS